MINVFQINFPDGNSARAVRIESKNQLKEALSQLGLKSGRPTFVLVGGAGGIKDEELNRLYPLFVKSLSPSFEKLGAFVIDGGTDSGIMKLMGKARKEINATFSLVGVAASGTIKLPETDKVNLNVANLESNHTHFVIVPGSNWGDESYWLDRVARIVASGFQAVTILINGGEITRKDVQISLDAKRPVVIVAGSGRLADELALNPTKSSLFHIINLNEDPEKIIQLLTILIKKGDINGKI